MERRYRLQKNKAFQYVYHRGRSAACRDLVMLVAKGRGMKVGFSVSKKVGNAVTRNKVKRRLRECFRPYLGDVKSGLYVVVARPSAAAASFSSLQKDVRYLLKKHGASIIMQSIGSVMTYGMNKILLGFSSTAAPSAPIRAARAAAIRPLAASTRKPPSSATGLSRVRGWRHGASCAAIRSPKAAMIPFPKTPVPH